LTSFTVRKPHVAPFGAMLGVKKERSARHVAKLYVDFLWVTQRLGMK